ncbi:MAG: DNA primase [Candidatus Absconditabacterales bacterium]|nr:DNA primase [Candidatus Absconditabacterales bacterium]
MVNVADYILDNVDIVDIISRRVNLKRAGSNFSGLSPFQHEKTPSFMVSPQKQIFKDFSSGVGGNVITFIMEYEKLDFWDAIKLIAEENRLDISEYTKSYNYSKDFVDEKEKIKRIHKLSQDFFIDSLKDSPKALDYLQTERKLSSQIIKDFGIGYSPDTNYGLITKLKEKGFNEQDLIQASLIKKGQSDYYSFFRNRIMFPIYDTRNNIVGFSARVLDPKDQPKYLNSSEHAAFEKSKILYGLNFAKDSIKTHDMLILVEGQMDVIALARLGLSVGVATSGTAVSTNHLKLMKRYTENIYILFDNDEAGKNATIRALKIAYRENVYPKMIVLPQKFKDIDDLANITDGLETFNSCIKDSKDAFLQIYELLREKYDMSSPIDKQKLFNDMFGLIVNVDNYTIQEHYKQLLADKVGLPYEVVSLQLNKYIQTDGKFEANRKTKIEKQESFRQPDREMVSAALFYENILEKYMEDKENWTSFILSVQSIGKYRENSILQKVLVKADSLSQEDIKELNEIQLRRDKELVELNGDEKKFMIIKNAVLPVLKNGLQFILKNSNLSADIKQNLIDSIKYADKYGVSENK